MLESQSFDVVCRVSQERRVTSTEHEAKWVWKRGAHAHLQTIQPAPDPPETAINGSGHRTTWKPPPPGLNTGRLLSKTLHREAQTTRMIMQRTWQCFQNTLNGKLGKISTIIDL